MPNQQWKAGSRQPQQRSGAAGVNRVPWGQRKDDYRADYYLRNGLIKEELLTTKAYEWAESFLTDRPKLTSAQLRRFYHEVKALEGQVNAEGFDASAPQLRLLASKVAYACPMRGEAKVPYSFADFMWNSIAQVKSLEEFRAFAKVFEAVVGFYYHLEGRSHAAN